MNVLSLCAQLESAQRTAAILNMVEEIPASTVLPRSGSSVRRVLEALSGTTQENALSARGVGDGAGMSQSDASLALQHLKRKKLVDTNGGRRAAPQVWWIHPRAEQMLASEE